MSTKAVQENGSAKVSFSEKFNEFLAKNKIVLLSAVIVFACVFIALVAFTVVTENRNAAAFETVETVLEDWDTARTAEDKSGLAAKEDELLASLQKTAAANKTSYAGARAYMTAAEIYFSRKDWKNAQEQYLAAAKAAPRAYTVGLNWYNAAVCADELGNADDAVAWFNKALEAENFNLKARALFNIGRIEEQRSKKDAAIVSYEKMAEQYPTDEWTLIAKSRIIALQIQQ